MKAAQINEYGNTDVIKLVDIDTPKAADAQVVVEVHAASLNPFDSIVREGYMKEMIPLQFPVTLGGDIAGVITEVGSGVTAFAVGDKVYGQANVVAGNSGAFAEFAATNAGQIAHLPESLDYKQAASLPLVGVSAIQALTVHIGLQDGQKILITGGAGGIGTAAIQIAKKLGAHVATTASSENLELVKSLGADEAFDYKTQNVTELLNDYDAIFDTVGGDDFNNLLKVLKKGGVAVSMSAQADEAIASELGVTAHYQMTSVTTEMLEKLSSLVEEGTIKPIIGKVFPLSDIVDAFTARETQSIQGKVVIEVK